MTADLFATIRNTFACLSTADKAAMLAELGWHMSQDDKNAIAQAAYDAVMADLQPILGEIAKSVGEHVKESLAPLKWEIAEHYKELKNRPALRDCGTWGPGDYEPDDLVTDHGTLWRCLSTTRERPGRSSDWRLMVKNR